MTEEISTRRRKTFTAFAIQTKFIEFLTPFAIKTVIVCRTLLFNRHCTKSRSVQQFKLEKQATAVPFIKQMSISAFSLSPK